MTEQSKMPARIWAQNEHPPFFDKVETFNTTPYIRADLVEQMEEALEFYSGIHEPGLSNPNAGPWGIYSTDFGERARTALSTYAAAVGSKEARG